MTKRCEYYAFYHEFKYVCQLKRGHKGNHDCVQAKREPIVLGEWMHDD